MAITPAKPDFRDITSRGRIMIWYTPTISAGGDTITVGLKRVANLEIGNRGLTTFTSSAAAAGGGTVLTITVTASCTGATTPMMIYGQ
jgi:hypothetical protein